MGDFLADNLREALMSLLLEALTYVKNNGLFVDMLGRLYGYLSYEGGGDSENEDICTLYAGNIRSKAYLI